jgi:hypothetical protein
MRSTPLAVAFAALTSAAHLPGTASPAVSAATGIEGSAATTYYATSTTTEYKTYCPESSPCVTTTVVSYQTGAAEAQNAPFSNSTTGDASSSTPLSNTDAALPMVTAPGAPYLNSTTTATATDIFQSGTAPSSPAGSGISGSGSDLDSPNTWTSSPGSSSSGSGASGYGANGGSPYSTGPLTTNMAETVGFSAFAALVAIGALFFAL